MYSKRYEKRSIKAEIDRILNETKINKENDDNSVDISGISDSTINETIVSDNNDHNNLENLLCENNCESGDSFIGDIKEWSDNHNITRAAFDDLLRICNKWNMNVPTSSNSLVVKQNCVIRDVPPGTYLHLGIKNKLLQLSNILENMEEVILDIGIDGLPLFKSSQQSLWPILGKIFPELNVDVLLFGVYLGTKKPESVNNYLLDFASELSDLLKTGINFKGRTIGIKCRAFICDTPAKVFLCETVGHNSLVGCTRCCQIGRRYNMRTIYTTSKSTPRTDENFFLRTYKNYHKTSANERSVLENMGVKMISQFPLDPMHLVDLGVVKKMLVCIFDGKCNHFRINAEKKTCLSTKILSLVHHIPQEFVRKPRDFTEIKRWKAVEFRQFVLYTGVFFIKRCSKH